MEGDVLDSERLTAAMAGCSLAYHAAGVNHFCMTDPRPMMEVNVEGTKKVVEAAASCGIRRVIYTSSAATLGEARGTTGDEGTVHRGWFLSTYERSKYEAELGARQAAERLGVELVCVNPSSVQGPGRTSGTARWLIRYASGRLRWMIQTRVSLVDIADCTEAHIQAADRGVAGERYVISGPSHSIQELIRIVGAVTGRSYPVHFLPAAPAVAVGSAVGTAFKLIGRQPPVCREMIRTLAHGHAYDGSRSARELGFAYTPIEKSLESAMAWYSDHGYLTSPVANA